MLRNFYKASYFSTLPTELCRWLIVGMLGLMACQTKPGKIAVFFPDQTPELYKKIPSIGYNRWPRAIPWTPCRTT